MQAPKVQCILEAARRQCYCTKERLYQGAQYPARLSQDESIGLTNDPSYVNWINLLQLFINWISGPTRTSNFFVKPKLQRIYKSHLFSHSYHHFRSGFKAEEPKLEMFVSLSPHHSNESRDKKTTWNNSEISERCTWECARCGFPRRNRPRPSPLPLGYVNESEFTW